MRSARRCAWSAGRFGRTTPCLRDPVPEVAVTNSRPSPSPPALSPGSQSPPRAAPALLPAEPKPAPPEAAPELPAVTPPPLAESPGLAIQPGVSKAAAPTADISPGSHDFAVILPGHREEAVAERTFSVVSRRWMRVQFLLQRRLDALTMRTPRRAEFQEHQAGQVIDFFTRKFGRHFRVLLNDRL